MMKNMTAHEQHDQREKINKIASDFDTIKRWWPAVVFLFSVVCVTGSVVTYFWNWNNTVVKKDQLPSEILKGVYKISEKQDKRAVRDSLLLISINQNNEEIKRQLAIDKEFYKEQLQIIKRDIKKMEHGVSFYDASGKRIEALTKN